MITAAGIGKGTTEKQRPFLDKLQVQWIDIARAPKHQGRDFILEPFGQIPGVELAEVGVVYLDIAPLIPIRAKREDSLITSDDGAGSCLGHRNWFVRPHHDPDPYRG